MLGDCIWYENNLCELPFVCEGKEVKPCIGFDKCKSFIVTNVENGVDYIKTQDGRWIPK